MRSKETNLLVGPLKRIAAVASALVLASCSSDVALYSGRDAAKLRLSVGYLTGGKLITSLPPQLVASRGHVETIDRQEIAPQITPISTSVALVKPGDHEITVRLQGTRAFSSSMATRVHLKPENTYRLYLSGAFVARDFILLNEGSGEETRLALRDLGVQRN